MKLSVPALLLLLCPLVPPVRAAFLIFPDNATPTVASDNFKQGMDAYKRGDYARAVKFFAAEAERGNKDAQFALGRIYQDGSGVVQSLPQAEAFYRRAAAQGHADAQGNLATILLSTSRDQEGLSWLKKGAENGCLRAMVTMANFLVTGTGVPKDPAAAKALLDKAAAAGDGEAYEALSLLYETGTGVPKDPAKALELLNEASKRNSVKAMLKLAVRYLNGTGTPKDPAKAKALLERASDLGTTEAQLALGNLYSSKDFPEKNAVKAMEWYQKASEAGDALATFKMGVLYSEGADGLPKDDVKAMACFERAANGGQTAAMFNMGTYYEKGRGVAANPESAVKWQLKSAIGGFGVAQREVGLRYREGRGVNKDSVAALSWLGRAAVSGDAAAAVTLADMLITGEGGLPPDVKNALAILTRASELDIAPAQVRLGEVLASGISGRPELVRAYAIALAVDSKYEPGTRLRAELEKKMTPEQIIEAKKEFERLKSKSAAETNVSAAGTQPATQ
ncbi:MAG: hypothetical protein EOP86_05625 [Verrucomicrobiaceae bacterium]|nr:MAG: hypothetical protein EOP86_05625 [Verrucomicrobiaceae bacterium]